MKAEENIIPDALLRGGCIRTFYRVATRLAERQLERIPEFYVLESRKICLLSKTDFQELARLLAETEAREVVSGGLNCGGATLLLRAETVSEVETGHTGAG